MNIPIKNIYYLLCYAWNKLDISEQVEVSFDSITEMLDLLASVLVYSSKRILKRGIDKNYIDYKNEFKGVKGKIDISATIKRNLLSKHKTVCSFDDFSSNILLNRILVSTIYKLTRTENLNKAIKNDLISIYRMLCGIEQIELTERLFKQIKLKRNNHFYGLVINVCKIIYENTLPSETAGRYLFSDFTRDEKKMNRLFEEFIRNFYKIEQNKFPSVKSENIYWNFTCSSPENINYLPKMITDISLENDDEKIIIDAKYYHETMVINNYGNEKIRSNNLYQLFSYLLNQHKTDKTDEIYKKTKNATGILLYPTIEKEYDLEYKYDDHKVQIKTLNLNTDWQSIRTRLKSIIQAEQ